MTNRLEWTVEYVVRLGAGSTLLLLAGLLAMAVFRRQSAAMRYWIGTWNGLALLLLPLAAAVLPSWQLGLLDSGELNYELEDSSQETVQLAVAETVLKPHNGFGDERRAGQQGVSRLDRSTAAIAADTQFGLSNHEAGDRDQRPPADSQHYELSASQFTARSSIVISILVIYALGLGVGLWQLLFAHYAIGKWIHKARSDLPEWILQIVEDCRVTMCLSREVTVQLTDRVAVPVVAGLVRPLILLPESAVDWPAERVRAAVAHEMAHVERGDLWTQLLSQLVHCIYWPQPLVYWWNRSLRSQREAACDDRVLACYPHRSQYARHLLDVAAELTNREQPQPAALAMRVVPKLNGELQPYSRRPVVAPLRREALWRGCALWQSSVRSLWRRSVHSLH